MASWEHQHLQKWSLIFSLAFSNVAVRWTTSFQEAPLGPRVTNKTTFLILFFKDSTQGELNLSKMLASLVSMVPWHLSLPYKVPTVWFHQFEGMFSLDPIVCPVLLQVFLAFQYLLMRHC